MPDAAQLLRSFVERTGPVDVEVNARLETGDPAKVIVAVAAQGYDIIVMRTHGRSGVTHFLKGRITERVVRHAPCPVLTVHVSESDSDPMGIGPGSDPLAIPLPP